MRSLRFTEIDLEIAREEREIRAREPVIETPVRAETELPRERPVTAKEPHLYAKRGDFKLYVCDSVRRILGGER